MIICLNFKLHYLLKVEVKVKEVRNQRKMSNFRSYLSEFFHKLTYTVRFYHYLSQFFPDCVCDIVLLFDFIYIKLQCL